MQRTGDGEWSCKAATSVALSVAQMLPGRLGRQYNRFRREQRCLAGIWVEEYWAQAGSRITE